MRDDRPPAVVAADQATLYKPPAQRGWQAAQAREAARALEKIEEQEEERLKLEEEERVKAGKRRRLFLVE